MPLDKKSVQIPFSKRLQLTNRLPWVPEPQNFEGVNRMPRREAEKSLAQIDTPPFSHSYLLFPLSKSGLPKLYLVTSSNGLFIFV